MKAVILAAGKGSRLGVPDRPKPLTPLINGKTILAYQLDLLVPAVAYDEIIVVVGYQKEKILDAYPGLLYVYNPLYAAENTSKSLLRALKKVEDDVLWINGDVVFHPLVLERLLEGKGSRMVVNAGPVGEEEVKYRTDSLGRIIEVSKLVQQAEGEALGINIIEKKSLPAFRQSLEECGAMDYFEKGVEICIQRGIDFYAVPVAEDLCVEVDFPEDLERAKVLAAQITSF